MLYCLVVCCYIFFFFKQKTAYEMRISDWSSDVCSSDLDRQGRVLVPSYLREYAGLTGSEVVVVGALNRLEIWAAARWQPYRSQIEIGRASCRERVCQYV